MLLTQATKRTLESGKAEVRKPALRSRRVWVSPPPGPGSFQSAQHPSPSWAARLASWFSGPGVGASSCPPWPEAAEASPGRTSQQSGYPSLSPPLGD